MLEVKYVEFITAFQPTLIDLLIITFILPAAVESSIQCFLFRYFGSYQDEQRKL